jgi:hypothetical protein
LESFQRSVGMLGEIKQHYGLASSALSTIPFWGRGTSPPAPLQMRGESIPSPLGDRAASRSAGEGGKGGVELSSLWTKPSGIGVFNRPISGRTRATISTARIISMPPVTTAISGPNSEAANPDSKEACSLLAYGGGEEKGNDLSSRPSAKEDGRLFGKSVSPTGLSSSRDVLASI